MPCANPDAWFDNKGEPKFHDKTDVEITTPPLAPAHRATCADFSEENANYEIEGTIYPPSQPDSAPRTIGHLCSEYTTEELQECVPYSKDLQLCHDYAGFMHA